MLGRAVLVACAVAWIFGVLLGWRELVVASAACLVALVIAVVSTLGRVDLRVAIVLHPIRVVAGDRAIADITVTNASGRTMLPLQLETPVGKGDAVLDVPTLRPDESFENAIVIPTARRAVVAVGPACSVRGDPLGLARREHVWTDRQELFVHPRTVSLEGITPGWLRDLEGRPTPDLSPSDVAFHTLREYVPGDDRRHVHWRSSAKTGRLMVRQYVDNRRSHLALVIDANPETYADADEFELAVSLAASLGLRAIRDGEETSCVGGDQLIAGHTGQALLDGLSRIELGQRASSLAELAVRAGPFVSNASVVALATGSGASPLDLEGAARRLSGSSQTLCVIADQKKGTAGVREHQGMMVLQVDSLESFARALKALSKR